MRLTWRSGLAASVIALVMAADSLLLQPAAQQTDTAVSQKRFQDLYAAGNYSAALAEAQKAEAAAERSGMRTFRHSTTWLAPTRRWADMPKPPAQDLSAYRRDREKALVETLAKPAGQSDHAQVDKTRRQIEGTEGKLAATGEGISRLCRAVEPETAECRGHPESPRDPRGASSPDW
jgi:hypothetical protein